jgi:hypothetical protein
MSLPIRLFIFSPNQTINSPAEMRGCFIGKLLQFLAAFAAEFTRVCRAARALCTAAKNAPKAI